MENNYYQDDYDVWTGPHDLQDMIKRNSYSRAFLGLVKRGHRDQDDFYNQQNEFQNGNQFVPEEFMQQFNPL